MWKPLSFDPTDYTTRESDGCDGCILDGLSCSGLKLAVKLDEIHGCCMKGHIYVPLMCKFDDDMEKFDPEDDFGIRV
jgi:hypothetical protein